jgi:hypothetical protein
LSSTKPTEIKKFNFLADRRASSRRVPAVKSLQEEIEYRPENLEMTTRIALIAVIAFVSLSFAAFAQDADRPRNRGACRDDVQNSALGSNVVADAFASVLPARSTSSAMAAGRWLKAAQSNQLVPLSRKHHHRFTP